MVYSYMLLSEKIFMHVRLIQKSALGHMQVSGFSCCLRLINWCIGKVSNFFGRENKPREKRNRLRLPLNCHAVLFLFLNIEFLLV